jgi:hypothetical protein
MREYKLVPIDLLHSRAFDLSSTPTYMYSYLIIGIVVSNSCWTTFLIAVILQVQSASTLQPPANYSSTYLLRGLRE